MGPRFESGLLQRAVGAVAQWVEQGSLTDCRRLLEELKEKAMSETTYNVIAPETGVPVKAWTKGVPLEDAARKQLLNAAQLPFIFKWIAAMPDVH